MQRAIFGIALALGACTCTPPQAPGDGRPATGRRPCFDIPASGNSDTTQALFDARQCQGGGVTWSALLHVLVARRGRVAPVEEPTPGWTGDVYTLNGRRLSIDDEGDAARLCSDDATLVEALRAEYRQVNADPELLRRAMAGASAVALECDEAEGAPPERP